MEADLQSGKKNPKKIQKDKEPPDKPSATDGIDHGETSIYS
jgi:hypothetical protein